MDKSQLFIVMPAYNEETRIRKTLQALLSEDYNNIVVVDDASKDNTYENIKDLPIHICRHVVNCWQWAALQTGFDYALMQGAYFICSFDSDGQHDPQDIEVWVKILESNPHLGVVLGSRFLDNRSNVPLVRRIILKMWIIFTGIISGIWLSDVHNGFRIFRAQGLRKIEVIQDRMEHASEILDKIKVKNIPYKEFPVHIRYSEESMAKWQRSGNAINIAIKLLASKIWRAL